MFKSQHISVSIQRTPKDVYEFASNPENLLRWAAGLSGSSVKKSGDVWICDSPMGIVKVKFADKNIYGVMDHDVTLPSGEVIHNPFRVLANDKGSEVVFTLYRQPQVTDADYEKDASTITADLKRLKELLSP